VRRPKHAVTGFAIVEVLVLALILSILAAIVIMVAWPSSKTHASARQQAARLKTHIECVADATTFQRAVELAHNKTHAWPDDVANVAALDVKLHGLLGSGNALRHLDGSQRVPPTRAKGWTYDFRKHVVDVGNCG
jgi:type II secretory pathway pseudopilin PulG